MRGGEGESTRAAKSFMALGGKTQNVFHSPNLGIAPRGVRISVLATIISTYDK